MSGSGRKVSQFCTIVVRRQIARYPWKPAAAFYNLAIASAGNVRGKINLKNIKQQYSFCAVKSRLI